MMRTARGSRPAADAAAPITPTASLILARSARLEVIQPAPMRPAPSLAGRPQGGGDAWVPGLHAGPRGPEPPLERPQRRIPGVLGPLGESREIPGRGPRARGRGTESDLHDLPLLEDFRPNGPWCVYPATLTHTFEWPPS